MTHLRVREIAEQQGLNITTLSKKAQISYPSALDLWNDKSRQFNRETLDRVALALNVCVSDLFGGTPTPQFDNSRGSSFLRNDEGDNVGNWEPALLAVA